MQPMIIDLTKSARKRAMRAVESALSWMGWNNTPDGKMHPKGSDGRWVEGHPFTGIMGDAPDHIHHMHDEDLAKIDRHVDSLRDAITREKGRRGIERHAKEISASRTYGTKPKEDFSVAGGTDEALAAAHQRTALETPAKDRPFSRLPEAERRQHALNRGRTIEEDTLDAKIDRAQRDLDDSWGESTIARKRDELKRLKDERALASVREAAEKRRAAERSAADFDIPNPAKPLRASAARKPKTDIEAVRTEWAAAGRRPLPTDRETLKGKLQGLTLKQLEELNGKPLRGNNKEQKINAMVEDHVGYVLNSEAIRHGLANTSPHWSQEMTARHKEVEVELRAADLRGDREAYARLHQERVGFGETESFVRGEGKGTPSVKDTLAAAEEKRLKDEDRRLRAGETVLGRPDGKPRQGPPSAADIEAGHRAARQARARTSSTDFDITDAEHRNNRIRLLTEKINNEKDPGRIAELSAERKDLAVWRASGKGRGREPFRYEGESTERVKERHMAAHEATRPAREADQAKAEATAEQVRNFLHERRLSTAVTDEQVLAVVRSAKLSPAQLKLLADEFNVDFGTAGGTQRAITTKAARELHFAQAVAGAHRRNPSGQHYLR